MEFHFTFFRTLYTPVSKREERNEEKCVSRPAVGSVGPLRGRSRRGLGFAHPGPALSLGEDFLPLALLFQGQTLVKSSARQLLEQLVIL